MHNNLFCNDLTTIPIPGLRILITGATGYIGGELIPELQARGYKVRVMVREHSYDFRQLWPGAEIVKADVLNYTKLSKAFKNIDCAYFLIHSLHLGKKKFIALDNQAAANFQKAAEENNIKRIIYLGGLGNPEDNLSAHLRSRLLVGEILQKGKTPVTFLRAAVIVGSGSSSYKMINKLIENCPVFLFPKKANAKCQPIAIRDVIKYLVACLETDETTGKTYDIGGKNVLNYQEMLQVQASVMEKKRYFIPSNFSIMPIYARIGSLFIPVKYELIKSLMESCVNDVVCKNNNIQKVIPFETLTFRQSLQRALTRKSRKRLYADRKELNSRNLIHNNNLKLTPPSASKNIFSDIKNFLINKPEIPTLVKFDAESDKVNYNYRILQRLEVGVEEYGILNIHKIGINVPTKYVFEELIKWDGDSTCWPNYIARVDRTKNTLESLFIYLFGWKTLPRWIPFRLKYKPLFKLSAINIKDTPDLASSDNARYLLYKCSGGYPIGVFSMYTRSSIEDQEENEQSQLFLIVGFNFYGKKNWSEKNIIHKIWKIIHNRVTAHVLNRIKQLSEWRFEKIQNG